VQLWFQEAAARDEAQWRERHKAAQLRRAENLPDSFRRHIAGGWDARYGIHIGPENHSPVALANLFVRQSVADFGAARCAKAYDEGEIRALAENYATLCGRMASLESCRSFGAEWFGIVPPKSGRITPETERARWNCPMWWRRQLRKVWTRAAENAMRAAGVIRKGRSAYVSDEAVRHRAARLERTREWLESRVMVNEAGEQLELLALAKASIANPAIRRGEFMTRIRGFEELSDSLGHVALFFTLTTPSRFHAQKAGGGVNPAWETDRARVRDGQEWLCKMWGRARAQLARRSILYYGVRVAEPHHDGTPHWHAVLFMPAHQSADMQWILRQLWLSDCGSEPGAEQYRIDCKPIDREKGSAVGYVAKYISKNIDAFGAIGDATSDETGAPVSESVQRVAAWASVHGIRQFQQMGGPPVGLWRELRRLRDPVEPALIESVRVTADKGQWCGFVQSLGGIERARRRVGSVRSKYARALRVPRVLSEERGPRGGKRYRPALPHELPAVWLDRAQPRGVDAAGREVQAVTRYGEAPGDRAAGVCSFGLLGRYVTADTRPHRWRIEKCLHGSQQQSDSLPGSVRASATCSRSTTGDGSAPGTASCSDSSPRSGVFSDLGPVAITVRGPDRSAGMDFSWVATVPFRTQGDPRGWTSRETSMAGPH
jgi:hypothetical protein